MRRPVRHAIAALLAACALRAGVARAQSCPPPSPRREHCILIELRRPSPRAAADLAARMRRRGLSADAEGDAVTVTLTPAGLRRWFGARVVYRLVERSSRPGMACNAYLVGARPPAEFRAAIASVSVGHQVCE